MIARLRTTPALPRLRTAPQRAALLVAAALSCAGCSLTASEEVTGSVPVDYRQRHPIAILEGNETMEVFVGQRRAGLSPAQRQDVARFAEVWRREATGGIVIDVPSGTPNARSARETAKEIRSLLAAAGAPPRAVAVRSYRPSDAGRLATVRLNYPRMKAKAGPCGLWPEDLGLPHDSQPTMNRPYWNLGCANQRNLAAMVANPADLVQPRGESPIYSMRRTTVMERHRLGTPTTTISTDTSKAMASDVGK